MMKPHLQRPSAGSISPELDPANHANLGKSLPKVDGDRDDANRSHSITLTSIPGNGPVPEQAFGKLLSRLLPELSLKIKSGHGEDVLGYSLPIIVLTTDPALSLAWRIDACGSPDDAFTEWKTAAQALLTLQRRDRRRIILVDPAILQPTMSSALSALLARLENILSISDPISPEAVADSLSVSTPVEMPTPEASMLAIALLTDKSAEEIVEELRVLTIGTSEAQNLKTLAVATWHNANRAKSRAILLGDQINLQKTIAEKDARDLQDHAKTLRKNLDIRIKEECDARKLWEQERKRLEDQINTLNQTISVHVQENESSKSFLESERQRVARQLADSAILLEEAQSTHKHLNEKIDLLRENFSQQVKFREALLGKVAALEQRAAQLETALDIQQARAEKERNDLIAQKAQIELRRAHAQQRIEALLASHSWRMTQPLRSVRNLRLGRS